MTTITNCLQPTHNNSLTNYANIAKPETRDASLDLQNHNNMFFSKADNWNEKDFTENL